MDLKEKLNRLIVKYHHKINRYDPYPPNIERLAWSGEPWSLIMLDRPVDNHDKNMLNLKVDIAIYESNCDECTISDVKYIIKCREWMYENDFIDMWSIRYKVHRRNYE